MYGESSLEIPKYLLLPLVVFMGFYVLYKVARNQNLFELDELDYESDS